MLDSSSVDMVKGGLSNLEHPVVVRLFTRETDCPHCKDAVEFWQEIGSYSDNVSVEVLDLASSTGEAERLGIDKVPAAVLSGEREYGVRFFGVPSTYELDAVLDAIVNVSRGSVELSESVMNVLKDINKPVHIEVFTGPTCPTCSVAVKAAHRLAVACEHITADMIDLMNFPYYVQKYSIRGVPKTVINEKLEILGSVDASEVAEKLKEL
ncbi:MAG: protein disulfide oxidoreductase [Methermicoccaceae archaeon]